MLKLKPDDPTHIGPYTIIGVIGQGGMGRVYLGHKNGQLAAVKVMAEIYAKTPDFRARFRREIEVVKKIDRDFTAQIIEFGSIEDSRLWYASEYVPGPTLAEAVHTARFSGDALVQLAFSLCEALAPIHRAGVVHRDFKPANIILGPQGVKVVDFGIAADESAPALTMTGQLLGTASYMAPEQINGGKPTPKWDVFAFGSVLAFAATGRAPYTGASQAAILVAIGNPNTQPNLSGVPTNLRPLIESCLQHDPNKRPTLEQIEGRLPRVRTTAAASTAWMPPTVTAKVTAMALEATRVATKLQAELTPTRMDSRLVAGRASVGRKPSTPKASTPKPATRKTTAPKKRSHSSPLTWVGIIAMSFIVYGLIDHFWGSPTVTSPQPTHAAVEVPPPAFTASKLTGKGNLAVTKMATKGRQLHLTAAFKGTSEERAAAVAKSCLKVTYTKESYVRFQPDKSGANTPDDVIVFGSALDFPGKMYFFAKCNEEPTMAGGQLLGSNKVPNDGFFGDDDWMLPVIDAYSEDDKLEVVLRIYGKYDEARYKAMCLKTSSGVRRVASLTKAVNGNEEFVVLTFDATQGTIYLTCSDTQKISYNGTGAAIP